MAMATPRAPVWPGAGFLSPVIYFATSSGQGSLVILYSRQAPLSEGTAPQVLHRIPCLTVKGESVPRLAGSPTCAGTSEWGPIPDPRHRHTGRQSTRTAISFGILSGGEYTTQTGIQEAPAFSDAFW